MVATTIVPKDSEMTPRSAMVKGVSPFTIRAAGTEPTPTNTRNAVPMTSAASFWTCVGSSMGTSRSDARCGRWFTSWHHL
jgi:hypothetical protein